MNSTVGRRHSVVVAGLLFAACGDSDDDSHRIRFDHLEVGQHVTYAVASGEYHTSSGSSGEFSYFGATLVMEVSGHDDNGYRVSEVYTSGDEVVSGEYYLRTEQNKLHVLPGAGVAGSQLFYFRREYFLPLAEIAAPVLGSIGLPTTPTNSDYSEATIVGGELLGVPYPHLNAVVDKTLIPGDGPASMWIYSATHGVVRAVHCGVESMRCIAFDVQPE